MNVLLLCLGGVGRNRPEDAQDQQDQYAEHEPEHEADAGAQQRNEKVRANVAEGVGDGGKSDRAENAEQPRSQAAAVRGAAIGRGDGGVGDEKFLCARPEQQYTLSQLRARCSPTETDSIPSPVRRM